MEVSYRAMRADEVPEVEALVEKSLNKQPNTPKDELLDNVDRVVVSANKISIWPNCS